METRPEQCPFCAAPVTGGGPVCEQCGFDLASDWQPASEEEAQAVFDPMQRACTACGELNPRTAEFCAKCAAPIGDGVPLKPFEGIFAEGFLYRRAAEGIGRMPLAAHVGRVLLGLLFAGTSASFALYLVEGAVMAVGEMRSMAAHGRLEVGPIAVLLVTSALTAGLTALSGYLGYRLLFSRPAPQKAEGGQEGAGRPPDAAPEGAGVADKNRAGMKAATVLAFVCLLVVGLVCMKLLGRFSPGSEGNARPRSMSSAEIESFLREAEADPRQAVRLRPLDPNAHFNLGVELSKAGDNAGAMAAYREAIRLKPDHAEAHWGLAVCHLNEGDRVQGIAFAREALKLKPDLAPVHDILGRALSEAGDAKGAVESLRDAVRLQPKNCDFRYNLAMALAKAGDSDAAIAEYEEVIRAEPDSLDAHWGLAELMGAKREHARAIAEYREVLRLKPDLPAVHYLLGSELAASGDDGGAIKSYGEAIRIDPKYTWALNDLAWTLATNPDAGHRDGTRAVVLAARALELQPGHYHLDTLAAAYAEAGRFEEAVKAEREALEMLGTEDEKAVAEYTERLRLYEAGKPYREPGHQPSPASPSPDGDPDP